MSRRRKVFATKLTANLIVDEIAYDGLHRRIVKQVKNSGGLDCTYHYYYNGQQIVETHNGSEQTIQQFVWGQQYIDELVQIGLNDDPTDATEDDVETFRFAMHNANFNVMGFVDASGALVERYEYTPYGERQVYISAGLNDPDCYAPIKKSKRFQVAGVDQPWGVNPVGHQGLFHDEETGLVNNRARVLHPRLQRFMQRDPLGYIDGMNLHQYVNSNPISRSDSGGLQADAGDVPPVTWDPAPPPAWSPPPQEGIPGTGLPPLEIPRHKGNPWWIPPPSIPKPKPTPRGIGDFIDKFEGGAVTCVKPIASPSPYGRGELFYCYVNGCKGKSGFYTIENSGCLVFEIWNCDEWESIIINLDEFDPPSRPFDPITA